MSISDSGSSSLYNSVTIDTTGSGGSDIPIDDSVSGIKLNLKKIHNIGSNVSSAMEKIVTGLYLYKGVSIVGKNLVAVNPIVMAAAGGLQLVPIAINSRKIYQHKKFLDALNLRTPGDVQIPSKELHDTYQIYIDYILYGSDMELEKYINKIVDKDKICHMNDMAKRLISYEKALEAQKLNILNQYQINRKTLNKILSAWHYKEHKLSKDASNSGKKYISIIEEFENKMKQIAKDEGIDVKYQREIQISFTDEEKRLKENIKETLKGLGFKEGFFEKLMNLHKRYQIKVYRRIETNLSLDGNDFRDVIYCVWRDNSRKVSDSTDSENPQSKDKIKKLIGVIKNRVKGKIKSKSVTIATCIISIIGISLLTFGGFVTAGLIGLGLALLLSIGVFIYNKRSRQKFEKDILSFEKS